MNKHPLSLNAGLVRPALLLLSIIALTLAFGDGIRSGSVDLAHHYALVARLMEHGHKAFPFDPSLAEMNSYPRLSHHMAALAGRISGSPLIGMQAVAVCGMVLLWAAFASLLGSLPQRMALAAAAAWAALLGMNHYFLRAPLHGDELVGNFFYAQLVGQALCIGGVLLNFYLEKRSAPFWLRCALMLPAAWLLTGVHLLSALVLLLATGLTLTADLLVQWREKGGRLAATCAIMAVSSLAALAVVLTHPGFKAMREISTQNGGMALPYLDNTRALLCFSAAIAVISAVQLMFWMGRRQDARLAAIKHLAAYGLAVSALCLAQGLAFMMGFGSEYAIRKYAFALNTVALVDLALLPALLMYRNEGAQQGRMLAALPAVLTALAVSAVAARPAVFDVRQLVALERSVLGLRAQASSVNGKYSYVIGTGGGTALTEYMMSIAHLHIPRMENANAASLLFQRSIVDWSAVAAIITEQGGEFDRSTNCRNGTPLDKLAVLDGACLLKNAGSAARIEFTQANKVFPCQLRGFNTREAGGTWTEGRQALLRCPVVAADGKTPEHMEITASAFNGRQRALVTVEGQPPQEIVFAEAVQTIALPVNGHAPGGIEVRLALPDAVSPQQLGLSGDSRVLGLFVHAIEYK